MLSPTLDCTCNARNAATKRIEQERLITFLVGLNDYYEQTRRQIMSLEPFPTINRVFSMISQVEDLKLLQERITD